MKINFNKQCMNGDMVRFLESAELVWEMCAIGTFFEERGAHVDKQCVGHAFQGVWSSYR